MLTEIPRVTAASLDDRQRVVSTLALAFCTDPVMRWIFPSALEHVTPILDEAGALGYLESSNPRNVTLYQRHGFEVMGEIRVGDCPPVMPMLRAPLAFRAAQTTRLTCNDGIPGPVGGAGQEKLGITFRANRSSDSLSWSGVCNP